MTASTNHTSRRLWLWKTKQGWPWQWLYPLLQIESHSVPLTCTPNHTEHWCVGCQHKFGVLILERNGTTGDFRPPYPSVIYSVFRQHYMFHSKTATMYKNDSDIVTIMPIMIMMLIMIMIMIMMLIMIIMMILMMMVMVMMMRIMRVIRIMIIMMIMMTMW